MVEVLLFAGIAVAVFVGFNIGGSSTGVAFGPAVGSGVTSKLAAATLMSAFALLGGATVGINVVETMGGRIVPQSQFTLGASVAVLFFVGVALLLSNVFGVPASTSMTAVGAIAGLGVASGTLAWDVMGRIVVWWFVAPMLAFWVCAVVGRYFYPHLAARFAVDSTPGPLVVLDRSGPIPRPALGPNTTRSEVLSSALVLLVACYMAFSAGASNVANAVAPLVGNGSVGIYQGVAIGGGAIALGAFTIARRTLDTVGNDLTELPLFAALIVEVVGASLITFLSVLGIPASLAVSATMSIVGLGWGRATRSTRLADAATRTAATAAGTEPTSGAGGSLSAGSLAADRPGKSVDPIGEDDPDPDATTLFDPASTARVIVLWIVTPTLSAVLSFVLFSLVSL